MKLNNTHRALYDAVSQIDPNLIEEATAPKRALPSWKKVAAVAAVVALLLTMFLWPNSEENYITAPGVLVVRAYETDEPELSEENSVILQEGITVPMEYKHEPNVSWLQNFLGLPFHFSISEKEYENAEITFEIWLSGGDFENLYYLHDFLGKDHSFDEYDVLKARYSGGHCTIRNNTRLWWRETGHIFDEQNREVHYVQPESDQVFVDIILRADEHIIGYAVIEILDIDGRGGFVYHTSMLKSVSFPKIEGEYQKVSEEYVKKQFQMVHDQVEGQ